MVNLLVSEGGVHNSESLNFFFSTLLLMNTRFLYVGS